MSVILRSEVVFVKPRHGSLVLSYVMVVDGRLQASNVDFFDGEECRVVFSGALTYVGRVRLCPQNAGVALSVTV